MIEASTISPRAFHLRTEADSWEEIWEAGPYYDRLSNLLEDARDYAILTGWQIDSRLPLLKPARPGVPGREAPGMETLKEKVLRICREKPGFHFYFLVWAHAYLYVLEREWWQGRIWDDIHPRVHFIFDNRHPFGGSHHEKIFIADGRVALTGGIDLCDDRWDSPRHLFSDPRRSLDWKEEKHGPYHDMGVQVTGPVCAALQEHVARRWRGISSIPFPAAPAADSAPARGRGPSRRVYLSRTRASIDGGGEGAPIVREIEFLFRDLVRAARHRIILEGQYFWSREINDLLISKMREMQGRDFEVVLALADLTQTKSLTRLMATYELSLLEALQAAARESGTRLLIGTPYVHPPHGTREHPRAIYIHSKLLIVDDRYISVGSANFASRAFRIDTEINLTLVAESEAERARIRRVGDRVLLHWNIESPGIRTSREEAGLPRDPSDIRFRHFRPRLELQYRGGGALLRRPWRTTVPFQLFFDPSVPMPYRFKRRFRRLARNRFPILVIALLGAWLLGAGFTLWLAGVRGFEAEADRWRALYGTILSAAWLLPIPFVPTALVASLHLGLESAAPLFVAALWIASLDGYSLARMFPTAAARYYNRIGPSWLPERLGRRSFEALLGVLWDPRVELRSKIAYQGLYCVPLPWFAFGTWLVLPAALYLLCRAAIAWAPEPVLGHLRERPMSWLAVLFALSAARSGLRLARRAWWPGFPKPAPAGSAPEAGWSPGLRRREAAEPAEQEARQREG